MPDLRPQIPHPTTRAAHTNPGEARPAPARKAGEGVLDFLHRLAMCGEAGAACADSRRAAAE